MCRVLFVAFVCYVLICVCRVSVVGCFFFFLVDEGCLPCFVVCGSVFVACRVLFGVCVC